ncbi:hypothetical protein [Sediminimonas qiaohouensis]|uniref:hypothetical protein n=1 Tax=Sediminimonas qiaohouensis TaxID=552061 RepID=UPI00146D3B74|nr:hypothetical protein [Sediminimonas qiaohouensis]
MAFPRHTAKLGKGQAFRHLHKGLYALPDHRRRLQPRHDFHSLSTHFTVVLKRKKCPLDIRKGLIGHELRDVTEEHYDPEFNEWVQSIEIDISQIVSPWRNPASLPGNVVALRR